MIGQKCLHVSSPVIFRLGLSPELAEPEAYIRLVNGFPSFMLRFPRPGSRRKKLKTGLKRKLIFPTENGRASLLVSREDQSMRMVGYHCKKKKRLGLYVVSGQAAIDLFSLID